jgi:hypothetical protein
LATARRRARNIERRSEECSFIIPDPVLDILCRANNEKAISNVEAKNIHSSFKIPCSLFDILHAR